MLAKMYNVKEKTESNDSFKVSVVRTAEVQFLYKYIL